MDGMLRVEEREDAVWMRGEEVDVWMTLQRGVFQLSKWIHV